MHKQYLSGDCGHYAILHCLEAFGYNYSIGLLRRHSGVSWLDAALHGMDGDQVVDTITSLGFIVRIIDGVNTAGFKQAMLENLGKGYKLIISVKDGKHWAAITDKEDKTRLCDQLFLCLDSKPKDWSSYEVWRDWSDIRKWLGKKDDLCLIALKPVK